LRRILQSNTGRRCHVSKLSYVRLPVPVTEVQGKEELEVVLKASRSQAGERVVCYATYGDTIADLVRQLARHGHIARSDDEVEDISWRAFAVLRHKITRGLDLDASIDEFLGIRSSSGTILIELAEPVDEKTAHRPVQIVHCFAGDRVATFGWPSYVYARKGESASTFRERLIRIGLVARTERFVLLCKPSAESRSMSIKDMYELSGDIAIWGNRKLFASLCGGGDLVAETKRSVPRDDALQSICDNSGGDSKREAVDENESLPIIYLQHTDRKPPPKRRSYLDRGITISS